MLKKTKTESDASDKSRCGMETSYDQPGRKRVRKHNVETNTCTFEDIDYIAIEDSFRGSVKSHSERGTGWFICKELGSKNQ